jgi:hypothetical protein
MCVRAADLIDLGKQANSRLSDSGNSWDMDMA